MDAPTLAWILASGLGTAVGGVGILAWRAPSNRALDTLLGFTAGVMLAAAIFSLIVPGLERGTLAEVLAGMAVGAALLMYLDAHVPHLHVRFREHGRIAAEDAAAEHRSALLLAALTIHNIPEGLAVGLAFAAGGAELGVPLALAIGIQNVPEGFAAGAPLLRAHVSPRRAGGVAALTGAVEPPAALLAFFAFELVDPLLVAGLGLAAGAMLYVVVDELIPESYTRDNERAAAAALLGGFALMMLLDNVFG